MVEFKTNITNEDLSADPVPIFASINKRYLNFLIDTFLVLFSFIIILYLIIFVFKFVPEFNLLLINLALFYFLYYFLFEFIFLKTPGKFFTSTKVVNIRNKRPSILNLFIRSISRFIPFDLFSYLISGYPRGIHDLLSKTITIDDKYKKIRNSNPAKNVLLIFIETLVFILISISVFAVFRYAVYNLLPDLRFLYKIPTLISRELSDLAQTQPEQSFFIDTDYGVTLAFPNNWVKVGNLGDPNQPYVLLVRSKKAVIKINKPVQADRYELTNLEYAQKYLELSDIGKIIKKESIQIDNKTYYKFVTSEISDGKQLTLMNIIHFFNEKVYVITYAGYEDEYEKYEQEADKIFKSLEIR